MQGQYTSSREPINQRGVCRSFKEKLGLLVGPEAEFELKEGTSPKFCKAPPNPFTLRTQVEEELLRLVPDGELQPVDQSKWATPIVVVTRKDGF